MDNEELGTTCTGVKPICPNGQSPKCVNGEWVCQGIAIEDAKDISDIDDTDATDRK